jgi:hypothetical protein
MNTRDIERALKRCGPKFRGVFSCDRLPAGRGLMVCNTDPHDKPGKHWIAINIDADGRHGEYFDSLGQPPSTTFERFLNERCEEWIFNERQLQSVISRFCGHYCVYYCMLRSRGIDMRRVVNQFTDDTGFNDVLVHGFVCSK